MREIRRIVIATAQGVDQYYLGQHYKSETYVATIKQEDLYYNGDPFSHFVGRDKSGDVLFAINCLVPCIIEY